MEAKARDAAEKVTIDYEVLPIVVRATDAVAPGAPQIYDGAEQHCACAMRKRSSRRSQRTTSHGSALHNVGAGPHRLFRKFPRFWAKNRETDLEFVSPAGICPALGAICQSGPTLS